MKVPAGVGFVPMAMISETGARSCFTLVIFLAQGIHVHFGIQINGVAVNPRAYLDITDETPIKIYG